LLALCGGSARLGRRARHYRRPCQRRHGDGQPRQAQRRERSAGRAPGAKASTAREEGPK
jgi:hypothetical protein